MKSGDLESSTWVCNVRKLHWPLMLDAFLADTVDTTVDYL